MNDDKHDDKNPSDPPAESEPVAAPMRRPYRKPKLESGERMEKTTLQSCFAGASYCGPYALEV